MHRTEQVLIICGVLASSLLAGCGSIQTVCERQPDVDVADDESTLIGTVDDQMASFPEVLTLQATPYDDSAPFDVELVLSRNGQSARFSDGELESYRRPKLALFTSQNTMLYYCDDLLYIPVDYQMTGAGGVDYTGQADLIWNGGWAYDWSLETDDFKVTYDSGRWSGRLTDADGTWANLASVIDQPTTSTTVP